MTYNERIDKEMELADKIKNEITEKSRSYIKNIEVDSKYNKMKNLIYFCYSQKGELLYIGQVSCAKSTSLWHRLSLHGSGAHKNDFWFKEVSYVKTYELKCIDKGEGNNNIQKCKKNDTCKKLRFMLERVLIRQLLPKYNDTKIDDNKFLELIQYIN